MLKKNIYALFLKMIWSLFGIDSAKKFDTKFRFKRKLDLKYPKNLADKVTYLELHEPFLLKQKCTDKYEVRNYLIEKGLENLLVPVVGGPWNNVDEIRFEELPNSYALKATHGCKMNYLVENKSILNIDKCKKEMNKWMRTTYGTYSIEPHYIGIKHRIYAEQYLGDMSSLIDYKIHCLNGEPKFILAISNRVADGDKAMKATLDLFDINWNPIYEVVGANSEVPGNGNIPRPKHFNEMLEISRILSEDFKFVRVDLYELEDKVMFGELTFSPACCVFPYLSDKYIEEMGENLTI